jgi:hypothetical protein
MIPVSSLLATEMKERRISMQMSTMKYSEERIFGPDLVLGYPDEGPSPLLRYDVLNTSYTCGHLGSFLPIFTYYRCPILGQKQ